MKQDDQQPLSTQAYDVLRCGGTEPPFSGKYYDHHDNGTYTCAGCGATLFSSQNKYDSGSGWPSFDRPMETDAVVIRDDSSQGIYRLEVLCKNCGGHLGHVFPDGPVQTTGQRFCINSAALGFTEADTQET
ncbi:peptide-methionine (R)-S-oxide reductase [Candidatus Uhrbacteria bacterium CG10_big_fil_rev_8_21_14_0_10_50_16]|uniref:peptide-methionine (R)-S-oxide reductase n=1 Tax=Candidatus Uhrbacteria bacterium CG10_big_fil_rev_8_21_14_0_10_50_16 TaxID=1975039 RepID=A0A2H0RLF1_9BACT|nr:MAG: peptide-methionine (R)-S-oxide reductase [Candidatus Uhrbacteria bacterium CG10_big_fil_rev_8_21_14_0_10_50_16]